MRRIGRAGSAVPLLVCALQVCSDFSMCVCAVAVRAETLIWRVRGSAAEICFSVLVTPPALVLRISYTMSSTGLACAVTGVSKFAMRCLEVTWVMPLTGIGGKQRVTLLAW